VHTRETVLEPRLLVVDDDRELCDLVARFLRGEGFEVECVMDAAAGIERASTGAYRLVLLDVMLGRANGFDVLRRIRATSSVPVVMLTAKGDALDRILGLEIGADEFDLLETLAAGAGEAISRESLVQRVLGREFSPFDRSIDTHVYNLRRKLGPLPDGGDRIVGIRGVGYLYACSSRSS